jgi:hypothetical protein
MAVRCAALLLGLALSLAAPGLVTAQSPRGSSIEGAWHLVISFDGMPDVEQQLATFTADGSYIGSSGPGSSTGHGAWMQRSSDNYWLTFESLGFDEESPVPATIKVWANITVTGDSFRAPFRFNVMLPDGTVVESGTGTAVGRRIVVEPS